MPRRTHPRSCLPRRRSDLPQLGARNPVIFDETVESFFINAGMQLDDILHPPHTIPKGVTNFRRNYRLYDDSDKQGITIVERRLSKEYAKKNRIQWNPNDAGRIRGKIEDEVGRLEVPQPWPIPVKLTEAVRVGDAEDKNSRKIALLVDQSSKEAELFVAEHELVMNGLGRELEGIRYPYDDYIPKLSVGALDKQRTRPGQIDEAVVAIQSLLPLVVRVESIAFTVHHEF